MVKEELKNKLKEAVAQIGFQLDDIDLYISENTRFGDYSTNVALQLAKLKSENGYQSALNIANALLGKLGTLDQVEKVEAVQPGFLNFFLKDKALEDILNAEVSFPQIGKNRKVLIEYGHANPLKEIHIGHLRTFILGESLSRLFERTGTEVFRANYQGDIGLHIAKAIWGIQKLGLPSQELSLAQKAEFLGKCYAEGSKYYELDTIVKNCIDEINTKLYKKDPEFTEVYQLARDWSLAYFEPIYGLLGIIYDRCFFESEVYELGEQIIQHHMGSIFVQSDGAVIFPGEKYGLHNRVFITRSGNPTYEGKEVGLAQLEHDSFAYDHSIHVVASEQQGYFQVVIKAIEEVFPDLKGKKQHLSYGLVDLKEGKMSSRTGNVISIDDLLKLTTEKLREVQKEGQNNLDQDSLQKAALAAIKFAYLKFSPSTNMVFDLDQSVSLTGDSGIYLLYSYVRAKSVLQKAQGKTGTSSGDTQLEPEERMILRQIEQFPSVVEEAAKNLQPNLLAAYLIKIARSFNLFYEKFPIISSEKESFRLRLTTKFAETIDQGLDLLGIETIERL